MIVSCGARGLELYGSEGVESRELRSGGDFAKVSVSFLLFITIFGGFFQCFLIVF